MSESILFDMIVNTCTSRPKSQVQHTFKKAIDTTRLVADLSKAKIFIVDSEFGKAGLQVAGDRPSTLLKALPLCKLPYDSIWIEYPGSIKVQDSGKGKPAERIGFLVKSFSSDTWLIHLFWSFRNGEVHTSFFSMSYSKDTFKRSAVMKSLINTPAVQDVAKSLGVSSETLRQNMNRMLNCADDSSIAYLRTIGVNSSTEFASASELNEKFIPIPNPYFIPLFTHAEEKLGAKGMTTWIASELQPQSANDWMGEQSALLSFIALLNSRNMCKSEVVESKRKNNRLKRITGDMHIYRRLQLKLSTKKYASSADGQPSLIRAHAVRGHFKVRKSGIYWWSDFMRGSLDVGTVDKEYSLIK